MPIAAVGAVVASIIVGSAVDLSRAYRVKNQLQAACDAGVLAGRRTVLTNGFDKPAKDAAEDYFETNFASSNNETRSTATFVASSDDNGNTVKGVAKTVLDTAIMRLFGFNNFALEATCTSSMGVGNSDVVMVLDNTGSMGSNLSYSETRLEALQGAMKNFYTTLSNATNGTSARIRYGFVPYSTSVNVGRMLYDLNPDYIADKFYYSSRKAVYTTETNTTETAAGTTYGGPDYINYQTVGSWQDYQSGYYPQSSCENNKIPVTSTYADYGSSSTSTSTSTNGSGQKVNTTTTTQRQVQITGVRCTGYTAYYYGWPYTAYKMQVTYKSRDKVTYKNDLFNITTTETKKFDHFDYKPAVEYDTSTYKTFTSVSAPTGDTPKGAATVTPVYSTWNGCIHERKTVAQSSFSYSSVYGISPTGARDLDIDSAPDVYDEDTKWAPMWPEVVYTREVIERDSWGQPKTDKWGRVIAKDTYGTGDYGTRPSSPCPAAAQGLKEMTQSQFNTYANSLSATGNTYLDIGMIWGGRLLSPDGIFSSTVNSPPANGGEVSRHIVFMTDGVMEPNKSVNQAWGLEWWDRKVTSDGSSGDTARHTSRFLASCEAIKDKGIRIWVIAFTSGLSDDLKACASDNSSFTAADSSQLNAAFQEIAKQVGELRITQ
ncbi:hypothetical protein GCM10011349_19460 [Novosphingobium indicum]|uniref:VWFA domain-containing protein n=1 Tax=Novosphingobium indicum TaxID=462949 RepID=A0ABQ2JNX8_9SPHN|nr:Tad domain-containing protein [Novosphingobium indicum]GGN49146.1 hypothetical protein GCM10011349_19460 [Novosphingobium indicum]